MELRNRQPELPDTAIHDASKSTEAVNPYEFHEEAPGTFLPVLILYKNDIVAQFEDIDTVVCVWRHYV